MKVTNYMGNILLNISLKSTRSLWNDSIIHVDNEFLMHYDIDYEEVN